MRAAARFSDILDYKLTSNPSNINRVVIDLHARQRDHLRTVVTSSPFASRRQRPQVPDAPSCVDSDAIPDVTTHDSPDILHTRRRRLRQWRATRGLPEWPMRLLTINRTYFARAAGRRPASGFKRPC